MEKTKDTEFNPAEFVFVTMFTYRKRKVFVSGAVNGILCSAMKFHIEEGSAVLAGYAILPDHVHILLRPGGMAVHQFVNNFKSYTGIKVKEEGGFTGKVWRQRFYDVPIEDGNEFAGRLALMHDNPVKRKYVKRAEDYPWTSYGAYHGGGADVPVYVPPGY